MPPELVFRAISSAVIAMFFAMVLCVLLVALRKELSVDASLRAIVHLGVAVIGISTLIALMIAYFHAKKVIVPESISQRIDTADEHKTIQTGGTERKWSEYVTRG